MGAAQDLAQAIANTQTAIDIASNDPHDPDHLDNINYMMSRFNTLIENMPSYEKRPRKFVDEFIAIMRSQSKSESNKTIFREIMDRNFPATVDSIVSKYSLNNAEIEVLCMLALGVSNNAIRILMDHTNNRTIYNIRSSLKSKLNISIDTQTIMAWFDGQ